MSEFFAAWTQTFPESSCFVSCLTRFQQNHAIGGITSLTSRCLSVCEKKHDYICFCVTHTQLHDVFSIADVKGNLKAPCLCSYCTWEGSSFHRSLRVVGTSSGKVVSMKPCWDPSVVHWMRRFIACQCRCRLGSGRLPVVGVGCSFFDGKGELITIAKQSCLCSMS